MNHQENVSFPSSKLNYFHKRGSYDRIMAVHPWATGAVEHNYKQCVRNYFMFSFWVRFEKQF
jgi:hypothetical protein